MNFFYLDENFWCFVGFIFLVLKFFERVNIVEDIVCVMEIMFYCIKNSWWNSEVMECDNGYGILGMMFRFKLGYGGSFFGEVFVLRFDIFMEECDSLVFCILSLVFGFVGYKYVEFVVFFIINFLVYCILFIDLDIWCKSVFLV